MRLSPGQRGRNRAEDVYFLALSMLRRSSYILNPFFRRGLRFLALPYCFIFLMNWKECPRSRTRVALDFFYIFFFLKYFPDNYSRCEFWDKPRNEWKYYYGSTYDPWQRASLRREVQPKKYEILYEDKLVCRDLCNAGHIPTPCDYGVVYERNDLRHRVHAILMGATAPTALVLKPVDGKGGHDIYFAELTAARSPAFTSGRGTTVTIDDIGDGPFLIQRKVEQSVLMNRFSLSLNTIRIVTLLRRDGSVILLGAYLRMGSGQSRIDNISQGGIAVPVCLETGSLSGMGKDGRNKYYASHPVTGVVYKGQAIPQWPSVVTLASRIQREIPYHRLLGSDIAVTDHGPVVIEINSIYDNVGLESHCGPILKRPEVLSAFSEYNLLINEHQKSLTSLEK